MEKEMRKEEYLCIECICHPFTFECEYLNWLRQSIGKSYDFNV